MKKVGGRSIDEDTQSWSADARDDPSDEGVGEAKVNEEHLDVELANSIKSFHQVNL